MSVLFAQVIKIIKDDQTLWCDLSRRSIRFPLCKSRRKATPKHLEVAFESWVQYLQLKDISDPVGLNLLQVVSSCWKRNAAIFAVIINSTSNLEPASPHKKCHRNAVSKLRPSKSDAWSIIRLSKWPWIGYPACLRQTHIILSPRWLTELVERNWCIKNWTCVGKNMLKKHVTPRISMDVPEINPLKVSNSEISPCHQITDRRFTTSLRPSWGWSRGPQWN